MSFTGPGCDAISGSPFEAEIKLINGRELSDATWPNRDPPLSDTEQICLHKTQNDKRGFSDNH